MTFLLNEYLALEDKMFEEQDDNKQDLLLEEMDDIWKQLSREEKDYLNKRYDRNICRMGIVKKAHWLLYGFNHGRLINWPKPIKGFIVTIYNFFACRIFGHEYMFEGIEECKNEDGSWSCDHCEKRKKVE